MSPAYQYEQDNLLTSLLNESAPPKEILNMCESTEFKDYDRLEEEPLEGECSSGVFKDLLDVPLPKLRRKSPIVSSQAISSRSMVTSPSSCCPQPRRPFPNPPLLLTKSKKWTRWPTRRRQGRSRLRDIESKSLTGSGTGKSLMTAERK